MAGAEDIVAWARKWNVSADQLRELSRQMLEFAEFADAVQSMEPHLRLRVRSGDVPAEALVELIGIWKRPPSSGSSASVP